MIEQIVLGITQGIAEWLPVSSEGLIVLIQTNIFKSAHSLDSIIKSALFLHLGTFFAALVYFRHDVAVLIKALFNFSNSKTETQKTLRFLIISTLISGVLGITLLKILANMQTSLKLSGAWITLIIGTSLVIAGMLQIKAKQKGMRQPEQLTQRDGIVLGIAQGFAALPGISRSGTTVAALLLLKFDKIHAVRLSFIMSLPIVLAGNIILNFNKFSFSALNLCGLLFSFVFGLATIHIFIKIAQRINFGWFIIGFGFLTIVASTL